MPKVIVRENLFPLFKEIVKGKTDGWILGSIDLTYSATRDKKDKATPLVAFLILSCAIDVMSGFYAGRDNRKSGNNGTEYKAFVSKYMAGYDPILIYQGLRCDLSHNFTLGNDVVLIHGHPELHKTLDSVGQRCMWNFENVYEDFKKALESYYYDLDHSAELQGKFIKRFKAIGIADALGIDSTGSSFS